MHLLGIERFLKELRIFRRKGGRLLLLIGIAAVLLWVQQRDPGQMYSGWQTRVWNGYQHWGVKLQDRKPLAFVVQIDGPSINVVREMYGEDWPWSRQRYADLLKILFEEYHVNVVGMDMFMPYVRDSEGNDALLALAQQHHLVFAQIFDLNPPDQAFSTGQLSGGLLIDEPQATHLFPHANGYVGLTPQLATAPCVGHVTPIKDAANGLITKVPPLIIHLGSFYPMLALEMLRCQSGGKYDFSVTPQANGWQLEVRNLMGEGSSAKLVVDESGLLRVPYQIKTSNIDAIFASDIFQRRISPDMADKLQNGIVLLAGTAPGLGDQHATPLEASVAGVTVHLQLLEWLLGEQDNAPAFSLDTWSWIIGFCGLAGLYALLISGASVGIVIFTPLLLAVGWLCLGFLGWLEKNWFVPMHPAVLFLAFLAIQVPLEWWLAQRATGRLRKLFQDYLPEQLVEHIVNDNRSDLMLPSKRCLTLLFADIANFTQRAERTSPEILAELTQQLLERLTAVAHQHEGTVDKYMGDAVMVFWNAPFSQPDHADRGIAAALDMMAAIEQFNHEGSSLLEGEPITVRIGVHTGDVVVGDLGTRFRHAYTAIGDAVNVTARLQSLARELHEHLVVSKQTVELLAKSWPLISKGDIALKGRKEAVGVYTLIHNNRSEQDADGAKS
ncbi:adenylate/guanylate cyclase domain-containing protein [Thiothrix lacustris]|uniref:Adenylate/guanylate cyclase domain-containing protein n=1 Tax=Thiothrix lacustris TaxID=525917 RepID=A0ABY9MQ65_9GAMM|nr:adenylate/guanylate cyclase domain-containing protein [Thiothrix lacustris]WML89525.1 adenylate/guanylate cyclase domain-containing protein [Thiothrix lacustris]